MTEVEGIKREGSLQQKKQVHQNVSNLKEVGKEGGNVRKGKGVVGGSMGNQSLFL